MRIISFFLSFFYFLQFSLQICVVFSSYIYSMQVHHIFQVGPTQRASSKQSSNLSMYMPKRVGNKGQPYLNPILWLISSDHPSVFLNMEIMFSYKFITVVVNSKGTFSSSNLSQSFFLGTMSKYFLKSTK
jgi:hypothetical protein